LKLFVKRTEAIMGRLRNPHPGEILKEEFLNEIAMSQNQLAQAMGVPGNRIHAIVNGTRDITGDTDLRLCKLFGLSEGYFLRLAAIDPIRSCASFDCAAKCTFR
jgi:addiction module HigA family antidote